MATSVTVVGAFHEEVEMSERTPHHGIIVGTDGSPSAWAALKWAAGEAAMHHVPLTVVHVAPSLPPMTSTMIWPSGRVADEILATEEAEARRIIDEAVEFVRSKGGGDRPEVNSEALFGGVVPALVDLSTEAKMVVVGCRGRSGSDRRLLGSVSSGVVHHARCPVVVVHGETPPEQSDKRPVLVGIDGSPASELATEIAFDEASRRGVPLMALHVWADADMSIVPSMEPAALQQAAETTLAEGLAGWQERYPEVEVQRLVEFENPATHLLRHSENASLVVVGSRGRGGFAGMLLGSVSSAVAHGSRAPVIVARQQ